MNHWSFQTGITLYAIHVFLWGYVGSLAWKRRRLYFLLFATILGFRSVVLFWLFAYSSIELYSQIYWLTDPLVLFAQIIFLCELLPWRTGVIGSAVTAAAIQAIRPTFQLEAVIGFLVGGVCGFLVFWKKENGLARGMMIAMLFPAIAERLPILQHGGALRFIPTISFVIGQCVWIISMNGHNRSGRIVTTYE
jgi:hypothetical protein